jgi:hypothetical protein
MANNPGPTHSAFVRSPPPSPVQEPRTGLGIFDMPPSFRERPAVVPEQRGHRMFDMPASFGQPSPFMPARRMPEARGQAIFGMPSYHGQHGPTLAMNHNGVGNSRWASTQHSQAFPSQPVPGPIRPATNACMPQPSAQSFGYVSSKSNAIVTTNSSQAMPLGETPPSAFKWVERHLCPLKKWLSFFFPSSWFPATRTPVPTDEPVGAS